MSDKLAGTGRFFYSPVHPLRVKKLIPELKERTEIEHVSTTSSRVIIGEPRGLKSLLSQHSPAGSYSRKKRLFLGVHRIRGLIIELKSKKTKIETQRFALALYLF